MDGPADEHCDGIEPVVVDPAACDGTAARLGHEDGDDEYGDPMYRTEGADDECKYVVSFSPSNVTRNGGGTRWA